MDRIDALLLEHVFSPLAGRLRHGLGLCQWRAALGALNLSLVLYLAGVTLELAARSAGQPVFIMLLRALFWLLVLDVARRSTRRHAGSPLGPQSARLREWIWRGVLLIALPFSALAATAAHNMCYTASLALLLIHLYLKAADSPPPSRKGRLAYQRT